jgi:polar amino acid transport system substrate-binding protein
MRNTKLITLLISLFWCLPNSLVIAADREESVLETIEQTGVVKLGIREDAPPFGYVDATGNSQGYCLDFFALLRDKLTEHLKRNVVAIQLIKSRINNRFKLIEQNSIDLECGPNTINSTNNSPIAFSTSFFTTGMQFLVDRNNLKTIDLDSTLAGISIGVVSNSTTEQTIRTRYPEAIIERFEGTNPRRSGVRALKQGRIELMVSDGILLRSEAQRQNLPRQSYLLIPETPLSCDRYGMILPKGDTEWQSFVNSAILSPEAKVLLRKWFAGVLPDLKLAVDRCQQPAVEGKGEVSRRVVHISK